MIEILPASAVSMTELCTAMNAAFSDYAAPMTLSDAGFAKMMQQRGLDREASRIAVDAGVVAAIWLVSVRASRGYLISSGTVPAFRSKGLARRLAKASLAGMKARQLRSFQTEVMTDNSVAMALYHRLNMRVTRELTCYTVPALPVSTSSDAIKTLNWSGLRPDAQGIRDWAPSWQNNDLSLDAVAEDVVCVGVHDADGFGGYAVLLPFNGTVAQIAVRPDLRRRGIARDLFSQLQAHQPQQGLRIVNAAADDVGFAAFMAGMGAKLTVTQHELWRDLM